MRFVAGVCGALVTSILVVRYLGPTEFGTYRLAMSLVWVLEVVSVLAFPNAATKFVAEVSARSGSSRAGAVIAFFGARATLTYALGLLVLLGIRHQLAEFYRSEALASLVIPAALAVLPGLWYGILAAGLQGLQRFRALGAVALAQAVVTLAGTLVVLALGGGAWELFALAIAANGLGLALAAGAGGPELRPRAPRELEPALRGRMWRYGLTLGALGIPAALLSERLEVFFLGRFWAPADVAFYSLAASLALHARRLGPSALGEVLFPVIARLEGRRDAWGVANAYVHSTRYLVMAGWPVALGGALLAEPLIRLLFGPAYAPAVPAMVILVVGAGIVAMGHPAVAVIYSQERNTFLIVSSVAVVALNIVLDLLLIPAWGAVGAAVANALVQGALLAVQTLWVARWLAVKPPIADAARSLGAGVLAFAPAFVLQIGPASPLSVALLVVLGLMAYPWLLAVSGALQAGDVARLQAIEAALPSNVRAFAGLVVRTLRLCLRAPAPVK
ncbi:MAG TPA: oligosaccharide flippase family protein [Methylomirabilota bacterium]